jgi:tetratricopeptide (TPR) repeat protein
MPRKATQAARQTGQPTLRITMFPATSAPRRAHWLDSAPWLLGLAAAVLLMFATVGWSWWSGVAGHALADFHYWQGREADRRGEAKVVVQRHWQQAVAAAPGFNRARLGLARSYIDVGWYQGAIDQSSAVIKQRRSRAEASLAYAYRGYSHYLLGDKTMGKADLEFAVQYDPNNALAQSVLERLGERDWLSPLEVETTFRLLEGLGAKPKLQTAPR